MKRVLSGIRATGRLHLGNYLGAVKGMLELQEDSEYENFYMVVDLHTMTTPFKPEELGKNRYEIIKDYLAAGLDPAKSAIFFQSDVPEHLELAFYFSTVATIARMQHLPTYKDKVKEHPQHNTMALLNYPLLMAADILIYKAALVPVGVDQEPHLEVAREIARKMNQEYGLDFPEPKRHMTMGEYIPSLKGKGKMSKSIEGSYINLTDSKEEITKKVRSIPTATVAGGEMGEGVKVLFTFANIYTPNRVYDFQQMFDTGTLQFSTMKDTIAQAIFDDLRKFQETRNKIQDSDVERVVKEGAAKARKIAAKTVAEVRSKMGLT